jgi:hypothetical protein
METMALKVALTGFVRALKLFKTQNGGGHYLRSSATTNSQPVLKYLYLDVQHFQGASVNWPKHVTATMLLTKTDRAYSTSPSIVKVT